MTKTPGPISVSVEDQISLHDRLDIKYLGLGMKKPISEQVVGYDLQTSTGNWLRKERLIDRENDHYREIITDPQTGSLIHSCEELLSQHRGHGSAKQKEP